MVLEHSERRNQDEAQSETCREVARFNLGHEEKIGIWQMEKQEKKNTRKANSVNQTQR